MITTQLSDGKGTKKRVHLHQKNEDVGVVAFTRDLQEFTSKTTPLVNPSFGTALNQNGAVSGTAEVISDGQSTSADSGTTDGTTASKLVDSSQNFTATAVVGMGVYNSTDTTFAFVTNVDSDTVLSLSADIMISGEVYTVGSFWIPDTALAVGTWDYADAGKVSLTSGSDLDTVTYDDGATINMGSFSAVSGKIQLDAYNAGNNAIIINLGLAGSLVGNTVDLNDFIDTGLIGSEQSFLIPKADLGIGTDTIDEMTITLNKGGGPKPTFRFDDLQIEQTGGGLEFCGEPDKDTKFHITQIIFSIADTGTGGTALAYDQIGAIAALTNGINLSVFEGGEVAFSISVKQNSDFVGAGAQIKSTLDDGTDTYYTMVVDITTPRVLDSRENDKIVATINDNLSGLLLFNIFIRGRVEQL